MVAIKKREGVIEKIKKLMDLQLSAERVGQKGEAYAAAKAIHKLLTQYNLSLCDIDNDDHDSNDGDIIQSEKYDSEDEYGKWRRMLLLWLAKENYCKLFETGKEYSLMVVVGERNNVFTVIQLYNRLSKIFLDKSKEYLIKEYEEKPDMTLEDQNNYIGSYLYGCANGLKEYMISLEKSVDEKFLAIRWRTKIDDYIKKNKKSPEDTYYISLDVKDKKAFAKGMIDGRNTRLHEEIQ